MNKLIASTLLICLCVINITSSSFAQTEIINEEDVKTIQNDSVVPRKILFQSIEALRNINGRRSYIDSITNFDLSITNINDPITATRNLALLLLVLFIILQIIQSLIGKITLKELVTGIITAIIMKFGVIIAVLILIRISDGIGIYFNSIGQDYVSFSLKNLISFVSINPQTETEITKEIAGKINSVDFSNVNLSTEGFCLTTIQDQYRAGALILNWVYLIIVYANWLILIISDLVLRVGLIVSPFIGISYIFGQNFSFIKNYWSIMFQAAITKFIFYAIFAVVVVISSGLKSSLTQSGVNLEYALFSCAMLVGLGFATLTIRKVAFFDNGMNNIINTLNKFKK